MCFMHDAQTTTSASTKDIDDTTDISPNTFEHTNNATVTAKITSILTLTPSGQIMAYDTPLRGFTTNAIH